MVGKGGGIVHPFLITEKIFSKNVCELKSLRKFAAVIEL